jgi:hypothetical protein
MTHHPASTAAAGGKPGGNWHPRGKVPQLQNNWERQIEIDAEGKLVTNRSSIPSSPVQSIYLQRMDDDSFKGAMPLHGQSDDRYQLAPGQAV